eukprot:CAMPEP_0170541540 /NCGR_PEP_ID=MMETSP0211-20121228/1249_1 /TAXON_ID=311385 /ORGANISM="Pseudokeronopsis sp., Strain OXSARD2" /LENGTH=65 /DNA_ID=CAMNT_0010844307 /DNA_START=764 /DNA_END=961 /DNA_ORIENTATION=-
MDYAGDEEFSLFFCEPAVPGDVISEVSSSEQVHHQKQVISVLESILHVHNEMVFELSEDLPFVQD